VSEFNDECVMDEAELERLLRAYRGRWLVVHEDGSCYRMESKGAARRHIALIREHVGDAAHLRRYRRDRVRYVGGGFEVTDARWAPRTRYSIR
jgi:hypothetical protein